MALEGLLACFPALRDEIDVVHVQFERPRTVVIDVIGEEHQGCPALVLAESDRATQYGISVKTHGGRAFIDDDKAIITYLSQAYGISRPSHD